MKIVPTLEGGLSIQPESDIDWSVLEMIPVDIGRPSHLAESLAGLMDDESEWDEWVVPDLAESFNGQSSYVANAVKHGRETAEKSVVVSPNDAESWYGALNQARLALQVRYHLEGMEALDDLSAEVLESYFRDRFYASLQSLLLEFVMDADGS